MNQQQQIKNNMFFVPQRPRQRDISEISTRLLPGGERIYRPPRIDKSYANAPTQQTDSIRRIDTPKPMGPVRVEKNCLIDPLGRPFLSAKRYGKTTEETVIVISSLIHHYVFLQGDIPVEIAMNRHACMSLAARGYHCFMLRNKTEQVLRIPIMIDTCLNDDLVIVRGKTTKQ